MGEEGRKGEKKREILGLHLLFFFFFKKKKNSRCKGFLEEKEEKDGILGREGKGVGRVALTAFGGSQSTAA